MRTITIGRDNSCDIIILNDRVSRRHATITPAGNGGYVFRDTSHNGTRINGVMVRNSERFIRFGEPLLLAGNIPFPWNRMPQSGATAGSPAHQMQQPYIASQPNNASQPYNASQSYNASQPYNAQQQQNNPHFYGGGQYMDRSQMPVGSGNLPNMNIVMILSIISIVLGFTIAGTFIGIILAVIALILADKAQDTYLTNPDPAAWIDYPSLKRNMILATIGFVINGFWVAFLLDYSISAMLMEMKFK